MTTQVLAPPSALTTTIHYLHGLRDLYYTERLKLFNLHSLEVRGFQITLLTYLLEVRRLYFDLIVCYRIVFGLVSVNADDFFFN